MTEQTTTRPERRTKTLPTGDTVYEADDGQFVASPSGTVHQRAECDHDDYDYEYHPTCGTRLPNGSMWSRVDADDAEEAVMKYNLTPCSKCIENARTLDLWRTDVHSAYVVHSPNTPDRWKNEF